MFMWSPLHYLYLSLYTLSIFGVFLCCKTFMYLWVAMEISSLLFWAILLMSTSNNYTSSMLYFLFQSLASLSFLFWYLVGSGSLSGWLQGLLYVLSISMKLGLFPFNMWYFYSLSFMPKLPMFLALTVQKLPPLIFLCIHPRASVSWGLGLVDLYGLLLMVSSIAILYMAVVVSPSLVSLILISSLFNTVWLVYSSFTIITIKQIGLLFMYLSLYSFLLYFIMFTSLNKIGLTLTFYTLMGFPPLPLFFVKLLIIMTVLSLVSVKVVAIPLMFGSGFLLLCNAIMLVLYFGYLSSQLKTTFSTSFMSA